MRSNDAIETCIRHRGPQRFVEEGRGDDPELASYLRIEERELEASPGDRRHGMRVRPSGERGW